MQIGTKEIKGLSGHAVGRQLLAEMYLAHTGRPMPQILISPMGKPYFPDSSLHFSISHTKRRVFCVLSTKPVGIDAEEMDRRIDLRLAEKILSESEKAHYEAARDKRLTLLRFWVLKEAAAKCTGEGLRGYPNQTDFSPYDPRIQVRNNCLVAVIEEEDH